MSLCEPAIDGVNRADIYAGVTAGAFTSGSWEVRLFYPPCWTNLFAFATVIAFIHIDNYFKIASQD